MLLGWSRDIGFLDGERNAGRCGLGTCIVGCDGMTAMDAGENR
jgi:hypothetical protein